MKQLFFLAAIFLSGLAQVQAQTDSTLDPVTITASLSPAQASRSARNIIVLPGTQFNRLPVHSIDELLRYIPGVEIQSRGAFGAQSDIVIRGSSFQQVLVMLDGVRLNDPITGHFNGYFPISPAEIERIEVLKGPASAIYGSEAVGGVVHIRTRSFNATKEKTKQAAIRASAGTHSFHRESAGGFYNSGRTAIGGGFLFHNSKGQPLRGTEGYLHAYTASLSAAHYFGAGTRIAYRAAYDQRDFAAQNFYTAFASDTATESVKTTWQQLQVAHRANAHQLSMSLAYKKSDDQYAYNRRTTPNINESSMWQLGLQDAWQVSNGLQVNYGIQMLRRGIASNDRGDHAEQQGALFAMLHYDVSERFTVIPAIRFDHHERRGTEWVPQIALSYRVDRMRFYGNAGKSIRDADFTERYNNYNKPLVISGRIGNPLLRAEKAFAWEAGTDYTKGAFKIAAGFFQRHHKGLIDYVNTPFSAMPRKSNLVDTGKYALAKNISAARVNGAELDIQVSKLFPHAISITGMAGLLVMDAVAKDGTNPLYLSSGARLLTNFHVIAATKRWTLSVTALYKERAKQAAAAIGAQLTKNYFVLNGKADYRFFTNKAGIFLQVDNILDRTYSDFLGANMPGRWITGGVHLQL